MLKQHKLPENIDQRLHEAAKALKANPDIIFAYIFGGFAKGLVTPLSDIDIAVYVKGDRDIFESKMDILAILNDRLQTDEIDLVVLNTASLPLTMRIMKHKKILIDKAPFFRHRFESLKMREYFDFSYNESNILRRRYFHG